MPERLIAEESIRLARDPRWQTIPDPVERAQRLRAAAERSAQDGILIEQLAAGDPRPVDPALIEREVQRQKAQSGCRSAFDDRRLRHFIERNLRVERSRNEMIAGAAKPTLEEMEAFFNANGDKFPRPEMFHASHIVKYVTHEQSEERAEAAIELALADLNRGVPFAEAARLHSDCKDQGGDLGEFPAGHMVEDFEEALRTVQPGQRTGIFTTPFGFHIALLHSVRPAGPAAFEEVRAGIEKVFAFSRQHEAYQRAIAELRSRANIEWVPAAQSAGA